MHQFVFLYSFPFSPYAFVILLVSGSGTISGLAGDSPTQKPDQLVSCQITNAPFSFLTTFYIPKIPVITKQTFSVPMHLLHCQSAGGLTISRLVWDSPIQKPDQLVSIRLANAPICFLLGFSLQSLWICYIASQREQSHFWIGWGQPNPETWPVGQLSENKCTV